MTAEVEQLSSLEYKLTIPIPEETAEERIATRLQELSREVRLDGFRPGKVPLKVVKQRYGDAVHDQVLEELLKEALQTALVTHDLEPTDMPKVKPVAGEKYRFDAHFEVYPKIDLQPLHELKITRYVVDVTDEDVDDALARLAREQQNWVDVERAAADGDKVVLDFTGRIDGEQFAGGTASGFELILGSKSMIPGFEEGIIGGNVGEPFDIQVRFPDDYHESVVAGRDAVFTITLHHIKVGELPTLDDAFAKEAFGMESLNGLRNMLRDDIDNRAHLAAQEKAKVDTLAALRAANDVDLPQSLLKTEMLRMQVQALQGRDVKNLHDIKTISEGEVYQQEAEQRVAYGLLLTQVVKMHEIRVTDEQVSERVQQLALGYEKPEEVISLYYGDEKRLDDVRGMLVEEFAIQKILEQADVTEQRLSFAEFSKI